MIDGLCLVNTMLEPSIVNKWILSCEDEEEEKEEDLLLLNMSWPPESLPSRRLCCSYLRGADGVGKCPEWMLNEHSWEACEIWAFGEGPILKKSEKKN